MKTLEFTIMNLQKLLVQRLKKLDAGKSPRADILALNSLARQYGIASLFAHYNVDEFFSSLRRSAGFFLRFSEAEQRTATATPRTVGRSEASALRDALAIGALDLARQIDQSLPVTPIPEVDDEDAFAWSLALHRLALDAPSDAQVHDQAKRLLARGGDDLALRASLLAAIADRDLAAFEAALALLTESWRLPIEEQRSTNVVDRYHDVTEANLFLDGLALTRIAATRGLAVSDSYPFIPAAVLLPPPPVSEVDE